MTDGNDLPTNESAADSSTSDTEGHMPVKWHATPPDDDSLEPTQDDTIEGHTMEPDESIKVRPVAEPDPGWRIPATDIDADVEGHASRSGFDTAPPASDGGIGPDEAAKFRP